MVIREGFLPACRWSPATSARWPRRSRTSARAFFDVGDGVDLARKLERLARDGELRQRLAQSEKHVVTTAENGARTVAVYERLLGARRR
jgi:hypothetical protein